MNRKRENNVHAKEKRDLLWKHPALGEYSSPVIENRMGLMGRSLFVLTKMIIRQK
jgi:hypothetical protein